MEWPGHLAMSLEHLAGIVASIDLLVRSGDLESHSLPSTFSEGRAEQLSISIGMCMSMCRDMSLCLMTII